MPTWCCRWFFTQLFQSPHLLILHQGQSIYFISLCIKYLRSFIKLIFSRMLADFHFLWLSPSSTGWSDLFWSGPFSDIWPEPIHIDEVTGSIGHGYNIKIPFYKNFIFINFIFGGGLGGWGWGFGWWVGVLSSWTGHHPKIHTRLADRRTSRA